MTAFSCVEKYKTASNHPGFTFQHGTVNLPYDTYLMDSVVTLYGGILRGVETLNISLDGSFIAYPPAQLGSDEPSVYNLNSITVLDGGLFKYIGYTEAGDGLIVNLDGGFAVRGGGLVEVNKLTLSG